MSSLVEANNGLSADALSAAARMRTEAFRVFILVGAERFWLRGPGRPPRPADCGVWREPLPSPLTTDSPARYHRQGAIFRQNPARGPRIWSRIVRPALEPGPPGSVRRRAIRTAAAGHCARRAWRPGPPPGGPRRRWRACHPGGMEGYQGDDEPPDALIRWRGSAATSASSAPEPESTPPKSPPLSHPGEPPSSPTRRSSDLCHPGGREGYQGDDEPPDALIRWRSSASTSASSATVWATSLRRCSPSRRRRRCSATVKACAFMPNRSACWATDFWLVLPQTWGRSSAKRTPRSLFSYLSRSASMAWLIISSA